MDLFISVCHYEIEHGRLRGKMARIPASYQLFREQSTRETGTFFFEGQDFTARQMTCIWDQIRLRVDENHDYEVFRSFFFHAYAKGTKGNFVVRFFKQMES